MDKIFESEKEGTAKVDNRDDKPLCRNRMGSFHVSLPSENSKIFLVKAHEFEAYGGKWLNVIEEGNYVELTPQEVELLKQGLQSFAMSKAEENLLKKLMQLG